MIMKKKLKKSIICFLTLFLLLSQAASVFAEAEPEEIKNLTDTFYAPTTGSNHSLKVPFSLSWFMNDAREYNHDLAKLSLGLATSAFRTSKQRAEKKGGTDYNVRSFMEQAGFTELRSDDYDKTPSMYTISTVMGHQTVSDGGEPFELIAVGVCGQGYMDEWESNLSVGTGENPEGFYSAAHLVYDRVFGYISENHLEGKIKIWISGFSRAAAVSNITASLLSDADDFSQENVFAYTFATPMTVRDAEPEPYRNIFNICGKMDPVPKVPFVDWGYSRYGITYYTPTMETDSDFWEKREKADEIYKDITGISYWANADMNNQLRILMECLLTICPDVETYADSLQRYLISLWEKHDVISIMSSLLEMSKDPLLINDDNRLEANVMMNQIMYMLLDYATDGNAFRRFNREASVGSNVMQTHTPELYVSWVFSADGPEDLYGDADAYTLLYVGGDSTVTLYREEDELEQLESGDRDVSSYRYLSVRDDKISVMIPRDRDYSVSILSNRDQKVDVFEEGCRIEKDAPEDARKYTCDMKAGDVLNIAFKEAGGTAAPEGFLEASPQFNIEKTVTGVDILDDVYDYPDAISWRDLTILVFMAVVLLITTVLYVISLLLMWVRHRYKRERGYIPADMRFRPLPINCVFLVMQIFLAREFYALLYHPDPLVTNIFKGVIGILTLVIAYYGYRRVSNQFHLIIIFAVFLLAGADILKTTNVTAGTLLQIAAFVLLCADFISVDRPGLFRTFIWIILSAGMVFLMTKVTGHSGIQWYLDIAYIVSGTALMVSAFTYSARSSRGSILLFASGMVMILNTALGSNMWVSFASAALYYISVCIMASIGSGFIIPRISSEYKPQPDTDN